MFGSGSAWGTNNNQQQQQQQQQQPGPSAFGQPQQQSNAFGSGATGFGSTAFGQTNPQPAVNPMFGGASSSTPNTFGGGTSAFGAPKTTGFGAFGSGGTGTSAFGSTGATNTFGQTNNTTSAFGQPTTGTSTFGNGNSLFGQKPAATTTFGSTSTGGAVTGTEAATAPVTTGSSNPPYAQFSEKDTSVSGNITLHYQSISTMPAYRGTSFEELRVQDYAQNRKTAAAAGISGFGMQPSTSTSAFGQPATGNNAFGAFGQTQQNTTQPTNAFGAFGQNTNTTQPSTGFGTAFGTFGQNNQQQQQQQQQPTTNAFGTFGQNNQTPQQQGQTGTGLFGAFGANNNNQPKPFGTFGSTGTANTFGGTTAFGQNNNQQQQQQQPNQTGTTGLFGQPANQNQTTGTSLFGSFGQNNNNNQPKPFGQTATPSPFGGGGLFGQNNQNQGQQNTQPSTGLFGNTNTTTPATGLFGQNNQNQQQQQQPQPGQQQGTTGLFGQPQNTNTGTTTNAFGGGGLFGNNNNNNNAPKPAGFGLFGTQTANNGQTQPSTGLFGQPLGQTNNQTNTGTTGFGSSLFGAKPASPFGQSTTQPSMGTGNLFGASQLGGGLGQTTPGTQGAGTLTASIAEPVQQNLPIFSLLQSTNQASASDPPPKKMTSFFIDAPTRAPLALSSSRLNGGGRLRGFASTQQSPSTAGLSRTNGLSSTMTLTRSTTPNSLKNSQRGSLLGPEAFMAGRSLLGADGRQSPKKLVLDRKMDPSEVFGRSSAKLASASSKVTFDAKAGITARANEPFNVRPPTASASPGPSSPEKQTRGLERESEEGIYYTKPPLDVLRSLSNTELSSFSGLVVGREGYGEVQFLEPVDLTTLPRLSALVGQVVLIKKQEAAVYPKMKDGHEKPPPVGEGLNVKTRFVLHGCWPLDKATGQPITDESNPRFQKAIEKLKKAKHTSFEKFDASTGTWVFTVEHFS